MSIRERTAEYPVAQGITRADEMAASDRRALLAAGDALARATVALLAEDPSADPCPDDEWDPAFLVLRAALVRWLEVAGERSTRPVFGVDRDPEAIAGDRSKSGTPKTNPCLVAFGPGPEGRQCVECTHFYRVGGVGGRYYKCDLRRVTSGAATDHRVRWPACGRFSESGS